MLLLSPGMEYMVWLGWHITSEALGRAGGCPPLLLQLSWFKAQGCQFLPACLPPTPNPTLMRMTEGTGPNNLACLNQLGGGKVGVWGKSMPCHAQPQSKQQRGRCKCLGKFLPACPGSSGMQGREAGVGSSARTNNCQEWGNKLGRHKNAKQGNAWCV